MKKLSRKRLQANRRNAQRSTDPVSAEGKSRAALNSVTHGLCAQSVLLPGESDARFIELLASFEEDFTPQSGVARFQVEQLAIAAWRLRRSQVFEVALVRDHLAGMDIRPEDQFDTRTIVARAWTDSRADLALRYENAHQRNFRHHYDRLIALNDRGPEPENPAERNEANASAPPASAPTGQGAPAPSNQSPVEQNTISPSEPNPNPAPTNEEAPVSAVPTVSTSEPAPPPASPASVPTGQGATAPSNDSPAEPNPNPLPAIAHRPVASTLANQWFTS